MPTKTAKVAALRREYNAANRAYHKAGKAAFGKPAGSAAKKTYRAAKSLRNRVGAQLGRLTGRKSRRK